jgi:putative NADPH-quinone reductase
MEADLITAQEKIKTADHIVWIYPLWWGMMPAIMKGFIDRVFVPGFAFKYHQNSSKWDKLLKGKTTEIICTLDYPVFVFKLFFGEGGVKVMRKMVLDFCGLKTTKTTYIGQIKPSTPEQRKEWLHKVELIGKSKN